MSEVKSLSARVRERATPEALERLRAHEGAEARLERTLRFAEQIAEARAAGTPWVAEEIAMVESSLVGFAYLLGDPNDRGSAFWDAFLEWAADAAQAVLPILGEAVKLSLSALAQGAAGAMMDGAQGVADGL